MSTTTYVGSPNPLPSVFGQGYPTGHVFVNSGSGKGRMPAKSSYNCLKCAPCTNEGTPAKSCQLPYKNAYNVKSFCDGQAPDPDIIGCGDCPPACEPREIDYTQIGNVQECHQLPVDLMNVQWLRTTPAPGTLINSQYNMQGHGTAIIRQFDPRYFEATPAQIFGASFPTDPISVQPSSYSTDRWQSFISSAAYSAQGRRSDTSNIPIVPVRFEGPLYGKCTCECPEPEPCPAYVHTPECWLEVNDINKAPNGRPYACTFYQERLLESEDEEEEDTDDEEESED